eukprot:31188-Pelagococcus_subviridis.AAC.8
MRRQKSLRIGVHHADAVVWGPVYRTHLNADDRRRRGFSIAARRRLSRRRRRSPRVVPRAAPRAPPASLVAPCTPVCSTTSRRACARSATRGTCSSRLAA